MVIYYEFLLLLYVLFVASVMSWVQYQGSRLIKSTLYWLRLRIDKFLVTNSIGHGNVRVLLMSNEQLNELIGKCRVVVHSIQTDIYKRPKGSQHPETLPYSH